MRYVVIPPDQWERIKWNCEAWYDALILFVEAQTPFRVLTQAEIEGRNFQVSQGAHGEAYYTDINGRIFYGELRPQPLPDGSRVYELSYEGAQAPRTNRLNTLRHFLRAAHQAGKLTAILETTPAHAGTAIRIALDEQEQIPYAQSVPRGEETTLYDTTLGWIFPEHTTQSRAAALDILEAHLDRLI